MTRRNVDPIARFDDDVMRAMVIAYRDRRCMTSRGVAREAGVDLGTLLRWIRGEGRIGLDTAAALAYIADLDLTSFIREAP